MKRPDFLQRSRLARQLVACAKQNKWKLGGLLDESYHVETLFVDILDHFFDHMEIQR